MAITITRPGDSGPAQTMAGRCVNCRAEFVCVRSDTYEKKYTSGEYVDCPTCSNEVEVKPLFYGD